MALLFFQGPSAHFPKDHTNKGPLERGSGSPTSGRSHTAPPRLKEPLCSSLRHLIRCRLKNKKTYSKRYNRSWRKRSVESRVGNLRRRCYLSVNLVQHFSRFLCKLKLNYIWMAFWFSNLFRRSRLTSPHQSSYTVIFSRVILLNVELKLTARQRQNHTQFKIKINKKSCDSLSFI